LGGFLFSSQLAGGSAAGLSFRGLCFTLIPQAKAGGGKAKRYFEPGSHRSQGDGLRAGSVEKEDTEERKGGMRS
jgi:hypothetical protein